MGFFEDILLWIGLNFTTEIYVFYTKIQGLVWSTADIVLVFILLKLADLVRAKKKRRKIKCRYYFLWFSAVITPLLFFARTSKQFLLLEFVICGIQFSILIYTVIVERKDMIAVMKKLITDNKTLQSPF